MTKYSVGTVLTEVPQDKRKKRIFHTVWTKWLTKATMLRVVASSPRQMPLKLAVR
jgi:hypothetical protein